MNGGRFISVANMGRCGCCAGKNLNCKYNIYFVVFLKLYKDIGIFIPDPNDDECTRLNKQKIHYLGLSPYGCSSNPLSFFALPPQFNIDKCSTTKDTTIINKIRSDYCYCYGKYTVPEKIIINIDDNEEINDSFEYLSLYRQKFKTIKQNCGSFDYERSFSSITNDLIHPSLSYKVVNYKTGNTFYKTEISGFYNYGIKDDDNYYYMPVQQISYIKLYKTNYKINSNIFYCGDQDNGIGQTFIAKYSSVNICDNSSPSNIIVNLLQKNKFDLDLDKLIDNEKLRDAAGTINIIYPIFIDTDYQIEYISRPPVNATATLKVEQKGTITTSSVASTSIGLSSKLNDFSAFIGMIKSIYECSDSITASTPLQPYECIDLSDCPSKSTNTKYIKNNDIIFEPPAPQVKPNTYVRRVYEYWPNGGLQPPATYVQTIPIIGSTFKQKIIIQNSNAGFTLETGTRSIYYKNFAEYMTYGFTNPLSKYIDKCGNEIGDGYDDTTYKINTNCIEDFSFFRGGEALVSNSLARPIGWPPSAVMPIVPYLSIPAGTNAGTRLIYEEDPYLKADSQKAILLCYTFYIFPVAGARSQYDVDIEGSLCDRQWKIYRNPDYSIRCDISLGSYWPNPNNTPINGSRLVLEELYIDGQYITKGPLNMSQFSDISSVIIPFISEVLYSSD